MGNKETQSTKWNLCFQGRPRVNELFDSFKVFFTKNYLTPTRNSPLMVNLTFEPDSTESYCIPRFTNTWQPK